MGITVYTHRVKESTTVRVNRKCSNCELEWTADLIVTAEGKADSVSRNDPSALEKAKKEALAKLELMAQKKKKDVDEQVLCPKCLHFSTEAMDKHFRKGYTDGLLSKYKSEEWRNLFSSFGFAGLSLAAVGIAILVSLKAINEDKPILLGWIILLGGLSVMFAVFFVKHLRKFYLSTKDHSKVAKMVRSCSDDELLQLVVRCYHENNNTLGHGDAWIQVLSGVISKGSGVVSDYRS